MTGQEEYENIIVGSGISGLICGGYLAKNGRKTLILEKKAEIGGRASDVYEFDGFTGAVHGPNWNLTSNGGYWPLAARELGANIKFFTASGYKTYLLGSHKPAIALPVCYTAPALADFVEGQLPVELSAETKQEFEDIFEEILRIPDEQMFGEMDRISIKDWMEQKTSNELIHGFFGGYGANMMAMDAPKALEILSAGRVFNILRETLAGEGVWTFPVPNTLNGMIRPFADAFESFGGQLRTKNEVVEVIVEGGKALGVIVKDDKGERKKILSDRVIVNALYKDIPRIFKEVPPDVEAVSKKYLEETWLRSFYLFTGLSKPVTYDDKYLMVQDPETGSNKSILWPMSLHTPWVAPPNKQLIWQFKTYPRDEFENLRTEDLIKEFIDIADEVYPGLKDAIVAQKYVSHKYPLWHHQYTAFPKISQKSPTVENLYFVGDGTTPQYGLGIEGPSSTGIFCAKNILGIS